MAIDGKTHEEVLGNTGKVKGRSESGFSKDPAFCPSMLLCVVAVSLQGSLHVKWKKEILVTKGNASENYHPPASSSNLYQDLISPSANIRRTRGPRVSRIQTAFSYRMDC